MLFCCYGVFSLLSSRDSLRTSALEASFTPFSAFRLSSSPTALASLAFPVSAISLFAVPRPLFLDSRRRPCLFFDLPPPLRRFAFLDFLPLLRRFPFLGFFSLRRFLPTSVPACLLMTFLGTAPSSICGNGVTAPIVLYFSLAVNPT